MAAFADGVSRFCRCARLPSFAASFSLRHFAFHIFIYFLQDVTLAAIIARFRGH